MKSAHDGLSVRANCGIILRLDLKREVADSRCYRVCWEGA